MWSEKLFVIVIIAAATPAVLTKPSGVLLSNVMDDTICKTEVYYNEDESRIPRVIKELKCAPQPYVMCPSSGGGGSAACCGGVQLVHGPRLRCTQLRDRVLVGHTTRGTYTMDVDIGCACTKHETNKAIE